jgi:hypothetical protein
MWLDKYTTTTKALSMAYNNRSVLTERERVVLRDLMNLSKRFHLIYNHHGVFIGEVPWEDDDNHGLPEWFFSMDYNNLEVDLAGDRVSWTPAMGPAPCWEDRFSKYSNTDDLWSGFHSWYRVTY